MYRSSSVFKVVLLSSLAVGCGQPTGTALTAGDLTAIRDAVQSYGKAWLTNDADSVMAVFVSEPVLSPSGLPFVEGQAAARDFWWPRDAPPTSVTQFDLVAEEAGGSGDYGFVRGTYTLAFEYEGVAYQNIGKFVSLLRKLPGGSWRITHHFWDDLPSNP